MTTDTPRTPLQLNLILHVHCRADLIEHEDAPAVREELQRLADIDILVPHFSPPNYKLTKKGEAFVKILLATPFPEAIYRNPITKKIIK
jgi:hypothetical protein